MPKDKRMGWEGGGQPTVSKIGQPVFLQPAYWGTPPHGHPTLRLIEKNTAKIFGGAKWHKLQNGKRWTLICVDCCLTSTRKRARHPHCSPLVQNFFWWSGRLYGRQACFKFADPPSHQAEFRKCESGRAFFSSGRLSSGPKRPAPHWKVS